MDNFINELAKKFNVGAETIKEKAGVLLHHHRDHIPDEIEGHVDDALGNEHLTGLAGQLEALFGGTSGALAGTMGGLTGGPVDALPVMNPDNADVPEEKE